MNSASASSPSTPHWQGPGADRKSIRQHWRELTWSKLLWSILYPPRGQRITPTISGLLLITLALGIGSAAYNTSNNILFITLSLLLACLILSGVLSALNLSRVAWRLVATPPFRVGQTGSASLELRNRKKLLPTYGLWFEVRTKAEPQGRRLVLRERLDPQGGTARLEWTWHPTKRGLEVIELTAVGSLFPFGFLRKVLSCEVRTEALVWPAPVEYQRLPVLSPTRRQAGQTVSRIGHSGDLLAVRNYSQGDSHRLIHWKASARLQRLMVRQFSSEQQEGFSLHLDSSAETWTRPDQFELLCSFVVTLAEDLFTSGRLGTVSVDLDPPQSIRGLRELEGFFDRLACLTPREPAGRPYTSSFGADAPAHARTASAPRLTLTFAPDGARGVAAYVDGQKAATA